MFGTWQAIVILIVVILLFGAKRIPDLAGSLGKGLKEFKKATSDDVDESDKKDSSGEKKDS
jgi:sec-independent protein translocase protein TatA